MKTVLAPAFKARMIGVKGWFSTNILGNRDGEVPDERAHSRPRKSRSWARLSTSFSPSFTRFVQRYLPQDSDQLLSSARRRKRSVDTSTSSAGWATPSQLKVNFLWPRLDSGRAHRARLVLFLDLAKRTPELRSIGIQEWLSFYLKSPQTAKGLYPEHDLFIQSMKLKNTLRPHYGADLITHLGLEYLRLRSVLLRERRPGLLSASTPRDSVT